MAYVGERPTQPKTHRTGMTYSGVDEQMVGQKPGITKQTVRLEWGVYKTMEVKLFVGYHGWWDQQVEDGLPSMKVTLTLPEKWLDNPTPVSELKRFFIKAYRKKHPNAPLSVAEDWDVAIKDESMLLFSKKKVDDDAIITKVFYDRQEISAMLPSDWQAMENELRRLRKAVTDELAVTVRNAIHDPATIVPVMNQKQIIPGQTYVVLTGWYKQQCVIVTPEHTVADVKTYLHERNGPRMPIEAVDIGVRRDADIKILDAALTLQQVYELAQKRWDKDGNVLETSAAPSAAGGEARGGHVDRGGVDSGRVAEWDERGGWTDADGQRETAGDGAGADGASEPTQTDGAAPSLLGRAMILGVGKRIQDRKHGIWLPNVHDPYSFRTPADQAPAGGTKDALQLGYNGSAPRGWSGCSATPSVNQEENCSIM